MSCSCTSNFKWSNVSGVISLCLLALVLWAIFFCIFGDEHLGIKSQIFQLSVLFISSKVAGCIIGLIKLPPMIGMLLMGVLLKNVGFINITGDYTKFTAILRQIALVNILLPAGIGLDSEALKKLGWMIVNLAVFPVAIEVLVIVLFSYFVLNLPWLWGVLMG